jgi:hypothetical protein
MPTLPKLEFIFKAVVSIIVVSFIFLRTCHITSNSVYVQFVEKRNLKVLRGKRSLSVLIMKINPETIKNYCILKT